MKEKRSGVRNLYALFRLVGRWCSVVSFLLWVGSGGSERVWVVNNGVCK